MANKLTETQKTKLVEYRQTWLKKFFDLEFNTDKAKLLIDQMYKLAKFKQPAKVILQSPMQVQIATQYTLHAANKNPNITLTELKKVTKGFNIEHMKQQLATEGVKLQYTNPNYYGNYTDYSWVCFYKFIKENIKDKPQPVFEKYSELIDANIFMLVTFDKVCYISRPPVFLNRDTKKRMHSTAGNAIEFSDGYGQHYVHGVYFTNQEFDQYFTTKPSGTEIVNCRNTEQKTVLIQHYGYEHIYKDLQDKEVIDTYTEKSYVTGDPINYELIEYTMGNVNNRPVKARFVKVEDHTTHKPSFLGVPVADDTKTVSGALDWVHDTKDYLQKLKYRT